MMLGNTCGENKGEGMLGGIYRDGLQHSDCVGREIGWGITAARDNRIFTIFPLYGPERDKRAILSLSGNGENRDNTGRILKNGGRPSYSKRAC